MRLTEEQYQEILVRRTEQGSVTFTPAAKRSKYGNKKVTDSAGNVHDSGREYRYWQDLQLREIAGEIRNLRRQVPIACVVNDVLVCHYVADAVYDEGAATFVVDAKSPETRKLPAYRLKLKLLQALHKIQIREV